MAKASNLKLKQYPYHTNSTNPSKEINGGDYSFGTDELKHDDGRILNLNYTSSEFEYCQITGSFTGCSIINIKDTDMRISISKMYSDGRSSLSFNELYIIQN